MKNEIINKTVAELSALLHARELSAADVTEAFLARVRETEPKINAYITVSADIARQDAKRADDMLSTDAEHAPVLCGIPYSLKDNIMTAGVRTTCASRMLEDFVPPYSATVYEKLSEGGGVLIGKNNLDEFAMGSSSERSYFGAVKNPIDHTRSAGGSSGGSAAAVSALSSPWSIGTDTGGSARQPASFCGVVSVKPTYGLVSRFGVTELSSSLDTVCPITRDVYDSALVLGCIAGRDERDMTSLNVSENYTDGIDTGVRGLRRGVFFGSYGACSTGCRSSFARAAEKLRKMGARVEEAVIPKTEIILASYLVICAAEASSNLARYDGLKYGYSADGESYSEIMSRSRAEGFGAEVKKRILAGGYALSSIGGENYYKSAKTAQAEVCSVVDKLWNSFDLILMPTSADAAFGLGAHDADPAKMYASDLFTTIANITGCPAITLPAGGDGCLPYGVTLMGARLSEKLLFRAAYALEDALAEYVKAEVAR